MLKTITLSLCLTTIIVVCISGTKSVQYNNGITGYSTNGCTSCHGAPASGGSITLLGIPAHVAVNTSYSLTLKITDATAKNYGFDLKASSGTFTTTNSAVKVSGSTEATHKSTPVVTGGYSFINITWKSPATVGTTNFTFAGVGGNNNNNNDNGDHSYKGTFSTVVVLPIALASFTGTVEGSNAILKWTSTNEINSNYFAIEKSIDNKNFIETAKVSAAGSSTQVRNYTFTDDKPSVFEKPVYYRIKMVDKDGSFTYSSVVTLNIKVIKNLVATIYSNPIKAGNPISIDLVSSTDGKANISLISFSGNILRNRTINLTKGSNRVEFLTGSFIAPGMYSILVSMGNNKMQLPLMIQ